MKLVELDEIQTLLHFKNFLQNDSRSTSQKIAKLSGAINRVSSVQ
jgi:hypothetical protein